MIIQKRHRQTCIASDGKNLLYLSSLLEELNLLEYDQVLKQEKISLDILAVIGHEELREIGVVAIGDR